MTKVIICMKRAKLLGWNHCEKVRDGLWDEEFFTGSQKQCTQSCTFAFSSVSKSFFAPNQTFFGHDYLDERLAWIQAYNSILYITSLRKVDSEN